MTDKELIQALRWCAAGHDGGCIDCPGEGACDECSGKALVDAADRLEALLTENLEMKRELKGAKEYSNYLRNENLCYRKENNHLREVTKMMPQWVSVDERLPVAPPDYVDEAGKTWFSVSDRFLAVVGAGSRVCEVSYTYPNREFTYRGKPITVSCWANLPEPPSTEGVE